MLGIRCEVRAFGIMAVAKLKSLHRVMHGWDIKENYDSEEIKLG